MCIRESGVCEGDVLKISKLQSLRNLNNLKEAVTLSFDELKVETNQSISDIFELIKEELLKEDMSYWILKNNIF